MLGCILQVYPVCLFIQILTTDPKICPPLLWLCWLFLAKVLRESIKIEMKFLDAFMQNLNMINWFTIILNKISENV